MTTRNRSTSTLELDLDKETRDALVGMSAATGKPVVEVVADLVRLRRATRELAMALDIRALDLPELAYVNELLSSCPPAEVRS